MKATLIEEKTITLRRAKRQQGKLGALFNVTGGGKVIKGKAVRVGFYPHPGIQEPQQGYRLFRILYVLGDVVQTAVPNILSLNQVDHILRQIPRMITDTLKRTQ